MEEEVKNIEGVTSSGFEFTIEPERLGNYELIEALADLEDNPLSLSKVVTLLLGHKQSRSLQNHVRDSKGLVPVESMTNEVKEIFEGAKVLKK